MAEPRTRLALLSVPIGSIPTGDSDALAEVADHGGLCRR